MHTRKEAVLPWAQWRDAQVVWELPPALPLHTFAAINIPAHQRFLSPEDDTIFPPTGPHPMPEGLIQRPQEGVETRLVRMLLLCVIVFALIVVPAVPGATANDAMQGNATMPRIVKVGVYVMDFKTFSVSQGTVQANFYLSLKSDTNVSIHDIEIINGQAQSVDTLVDTPREKYYRISASMDADPDLRLYPFDRHVLPVEIEPKNSDTESMVLVINANQTGLDSEASLPGWQYTTAGSRVENHSYDPGELPYSRAIFEFGLRRDTASTILKFFLPILLIIIVSLSSLMMKVSSRLGLNASMFLAAVLIHWRIADAIPLVSYATFLDFFMIITYATLVMVLVSGILIMKFSETKDTVRADLVYRWSIRIIPAISIVMYTILFLAFLR